MKVRCTHDKLVPVGELKPHPKNRNKHSDAQIARLAQILEYQGFRAPIVVSQLSGFIVAGHGRLDAAKKMGLSEVPVNFQEFESEESEFAHLHADNAIALWAELDLKGIGEDVTEFGPEFNLDLLGIEDFELEAADKSSDEDATPEDKEPAISKLGDEFVLGNHRLACGSATNEGDVESLMDGNKADMVFTDPPYRVAFEGQRISNTTVDGQKVHGHKGANTKYDKIANDGLSEADFLIFSESWLNNVWSVNGGAWYICFAYSELHLLLNSIVSTGHKWKNIIIWMKNQATLSNMDYKSRYEPIIYGQPGSRFYGERYHQEDIWQFQRTLKNDLHPTMKPVELIENAIKNSSEKDHSVLDLFGGSGSTLIACEKTNRKCFMMELEPQYIDVIITRWCNYVGHNKIKRNGEEIEWPKWEGLEKK